MKTENLIIRISPEEKAKLKDTAAALGMTVSEYVLFLIRREQMK